VRRATAALARAVLQRLGRLSGAGTVRSFVWHALGEQGGPLATSRARFAAQLDLVAASGARVVSAGALVTELARGGPPAAPVVTLTFDDGLASVIDAALPELEARRCPATVFVVTAEAGGVPSWPTRDARRIERDLRRRLGRTADAVLASVAAVLSQRLASWDELAAARERGLEVLPHTRRHRFLDELGDVELDDEIGGAVEDLRRAGLPPPCAVAWPYGVTADRAVAAARRAGLAGAFMADHAWRRRHGHDLFRLNRIAVSEDTTPAMLRFALGPGYDLLSLLRREGRRPRTPEFAP